MLILYLKNTKNRHSIQRVNCLLSGIEVQWYLLNPIHPIRNSLKKQKPCTKVQCLVLKPPYKLP